VSDLFKVRNFSFRCQSFEETIGQATHEDMVYCDPPYIDRHSDYYNNWTDRHEIMLFDLLSVSPAKFVLSTWHHNDFRENEYIKMWHNYNIVTRNHFYHVGGDLRNRNPMIEALVMNYENKEGHDSVRRDSCHHKSMQMKFDGILFSDLSRVQQNNLVDLQ